MEDRRWKISDWKIGWSRGMSGCDRALPVSNLQSKIFNLNLPSLYPAPTHDYLAVVEDHSLARGDGDLRLVEHHLRA